MIDLFFTEFINEKATHFVQKIWCAILLNNLVSDSKTEYLKMEMDYNKVFDQSFLHDMEYSFQPKIHTIRLDRPSFNQQNLYLQFCTSHKNVDKFKFAPPVKCYGMQDIYVDSIKKEISIDNRLLSKELQLILIGNDGFEDSDSFFEYFKDDFKGKIIHWTSYTY